MNGGSYDEVLLQQLTLEKADESYVYPCPCGDKFRITFDELFNFEDIATCPSCSLFLTIKYDPEEFFRSLQQEDDH